MVGAIRQGLKGGFTIFRTLSEENRHKSAENRQVRKIESEEN